MMMGIGEQAVGLLNDLKMQGDPTSKVDKLKTLMELVLHRDPSSLLPEFVPYLMELQSDPSSPVRKYLAEIIEGIGLQHIDYAPIMVPVLLALLQDATPAVARRAVTSGSNIFRIVLEQVALEGVQYGHVERHVWDGWNWMICFKDAVFNIAFQESELYERLTSLLSPENWIALFQHPGVSPIPNLELLCVLDCYPSHRFALQLRQFYKHGSDGVRLMALKFVENTILLFTPDPNGSLPIQQGSDGSLRGFNMAWIAGGHPVLDANVLGQAASKSLGLLLNQLRAPEASTLPCTVAIVIINSLAGIAKRRPSMFGRILPVLLALAPDCEPLQGSQVASVIHELKSAFLILLKLNQPGALPWRERLVAALRSMNGGDLADQTLRHIERAGRVPDRNHAGRDTRVAPKEQTVSVVSTSQIPAAQVYSFVTMDLSLRKRPLVQENGNQQAVDMEELTEKRQRLDLVTNAAQMEGTAAMANGIGPALTHNSGFGDNSVAPLISAFATLVAQGERGVPSVQILINSLTPDMLAEIVMFNMVHLPSNSPFTSGIVTNMVQNSRNPSGVNPVASWGPGSLSFTGSSEVPVVAPFPVAPTESAAVYPSPILPSVENSRDFQKGPRQKEPRLGLPSESASPLLTPKLEPGIRLHMPNRANGIAAEMVPQGTEIVNTTAINLRDPRATFQMITNHNPPTTSHIQLKQEPVDADNQVSVESAPPLSPPAQVGVSLVQGLSSIAVPAPVITHLPLSGEQQAALSTAALVRILDNHKTIAQAGGADIRIALLARLVAQSCDDAEALKVLQKHVLADYQANKGHELVLHILYQLFAEHSCSDSDSGASTSAAYDKFLLSLAQGLRDKVVPGDKSLSRLLGEAPVVPLATLKLVEELCNSSSGSETSKGEYVTAGLTALWSLILQRPPTRDTCLKMALKCTVHQLDDTRAKAIRLVRIFGILDFKTSQDDSDFEPTVANKLYPLKFVAQSIEDFATASLLSVVDHSPVDTGERDPVSENSVGSTDGTIGDQRTSNGATPMDIVGCEEASEPPTARSTEALSLSEAQRCMSLFFALCTKKHALLRQLFLVYGRSPKAVKQLDDVQQRIGVEVGLNQAVHRHIPILFRTIGYSSPELLQLIADPPGGSENLLLQVLHSLTYGTEPSTELIATVKKLYEVKLQDATFLIPVLSSLSKDEVTPVFPRLVDLSPEKFQAALARILQGSAHTGPALTPAEVLIALHGIDPHRDSVPLKKVMDACSTCLQQRTVFTQQVLAKVLNQLVEQTPLPLLFMRTVIQAVGTFPTLESFVMEILSRLVSKQIWKLPKLWMGFLKCAHQTMPNSFHVLLQLPTAQLEDALKSFPNLRAPLAAHADLPIIRLTVPRSSLVLLGINQDGPVATDTSSVFRQEQSTDAASVLHGGTNLEPLEQ